MGMSISGAVNMKNLCFVRAFSLCIILLLLFLLFSCVNSVKNGSGDEIEIVDSLGRVVSVARSTTRVAALTGSFADVWVLAGGELCAAAEDAWEDFELELPNTVNIGGAHSPSLEFLLSSDPELVLASASVASNIDMLDILESVGIKVLYFDVDNFSDYLGMLNACTDITGRKDLYKQNGIDVQEEIERIKNAYTDSEKCDKVLLLRASSTSLKAKGSRGTVIGEMLSDMGCVNIADSNGTLLDSLSLEAVMTEEPMHIFVVAMGKDETVAKRAIENLIKENPAWATLEAVKEGRVHVMDKKLFNLKPNERWGEAYSVLYDELTKK